MVATRFVWRSTSLRAIFGAALGLLVPGCDGDPPVAPTSDIDQAFVGFGAWEIPDTTSAPPDTTVGIRFSEDGVEFTCTEVKFDLKRNFEDIIAIGTNAGVLWPGALIQGSTVVDGTLASVPLPRSPISISIDLGVETASRRVETPNSATVQQAIAELQREADLRLGEIDVIPARIAFVKQEAFSFEQSMIRAGLAARYAGPVVKASLSGAFAAGRSLKATTLVVRLFQPMYTISFADEEKPRPSDFFAASLTRADVQAQRDAGTLGPTNQPTYVKSVTYGRMLLFTMTSTAASSAIELSAAMSAAFSTFVSKGSVQADLTARQLSLLQESTIEMTAFGGTQEDALNAIRSGDISQFFFPAPASTGVPISYRINNLADRRVAVIGDATTFTARSCTPQQSYRFTVEVNRIQDLSGCRIATVPQSLQALVSLPEFAPDSFQTIWDTTGFVWAGAPTSGITIDRLIVVNRQVGGSPFSVHSIMATNVASQRRTLATRFDPPYRLPSNPYSFSHVLSQPFTALGSSGQCTVRFGYTITSEPIFKAVAPPVEAADPPRSP